ncbi:MAG: glycoside hydrolase family 3 protein [Paracoccaceae bacterium]|nr:MAG: glycoside hydrolase family 3 protein [Paracoccaceae bacterium]
MMSAGATILGCAGRDLSADEAAFFREADPWGFILFARNVESPAQLRRLTGDLRDAVGRNAVVMTDQEGGRVQRLRAPHWREWSPPLTLAAAAGPQAPRAFWLRSRLIAHELRACGIDANASPCLDLARPETHPFLLNRCLGSDPATVAAIGRAVAEAHLSGGVLPVAKHMPGHGRGTADSHHHLPETGAALPELEATDFAPFAALADLPMAMTAHLVFRSIDSAPATTSPALIALIRHRIGFGGLLMTDDLSMHALSGDVGSRAAAALAAGCDIALHCNGKRPEMERVAEAAGRLSAVAADRAARAIAARQLPDPVDIPALEAELRGLAGGVALGG